MSMIESLNQLIYTLSTAISNPQCKEDLKQTMENEITNLIKIKTNLQQEMEKNE